MLAVCLSAVGCVSVPAGYTDSNAAAVSRVADAAATVIYTTTAPTPATAILASAGHAGAAQYWADAATDKQDRIRKALAVELRTAQLQDATVRDWAALATAIRSTLKVSANDSDQCLGLLLAAIRLPK